MVAHPRASASIERSLRGTRAPSAAAPRAAAPFAPLPSARAPNAPCGTRRSATATATAAVHRARAVALATGALLLGSLATGCAPLPPRQTESLAATAHPNEATEAAMDSTPATACALPIRDADGTTRRVNVRLPPSESAWLRLEIEGRYEDERVPVHYEHRSDEGREAGTVLYRCTERGFALEATGPSDDRWVFSPPLLVAAAQSGQGAAEGTVLRRHEGTTTRYHYAQAWDAAPSEATLPFLGRTGWWRAMSHAVVLRPDAEPDGPPIEWATSSVWAVVEGVPFAAWREVEIRDATGTTLRQEEARNLLPP